MERLVFAKLEVWLVALIAMACLVVGVGWSYAIVAHKVFPYEYLREWRAVIRGAPGDDRPLLTRMAGGMVYNPRFYAADESAELLPGAVFTAVTAAPDADPATLPEFDAMRIANPGGETRYFVLYGSFVWPEQRIATGAIAVDSTGRIHRGWPVEPEGAISLDVHIGLDVSDEGMVATNTMGILTGLPWCGGAGWQADWTPAPDGAYHDHNAMDGTDWHHDILYRDGVFWTFQGPSITGVDAATGRTVRQIHAAELVRWGWASGVSIFDTSARIFPQEWLTAETMVQTFPGDPFHFNKVDVLSEELAPLFPDFEAGDMVLSIRDLNLVVVVRPDTEEVVWWRYGLTSRQHDTTFAEDGSIEVFDNRPFTDPAAPRIARLPVDEHRIETVFDLTRWEMEMRRKGNFERSGERLLTVNDETGQMIAGRLDGTIDVLFENHWGANDEGGPTGLQLRNATEIAPDAFARLQASCGAAQARLR